MWLFLAGILMVYFLGFLIYLCYNTARKKANSPTDVENPSAGSTLSALRADGTVVTTTLARSSSIGNCCDHHPQNWRRPPPPPCRRNSNPPTSFDFAVPSCLYYDEITQRSSDLPQSALTAYRGQQLRQIKLEINELSRRLGIGQLYRERQLYLQSESRRRGSCRTTFDYSLIPQRDDVLLPITPNNDMTFTSSPRRERRRPRRARRRITLVQTTTTTTGGPTTMTRTAEDDIMNDDEEDRSSSNSSSSSSEDSSLDVTLSNSLPFAPNNSCSSPISSSGDHLPTNNSASSPATGLGLVQTFALGEQRSRCRNDQIFHQRQRRLRLIRMEIEDLRNLVMDRSISEHHAGGCSISSSDLEGLVFDQDTDEDDDQDHDHPGGGGGRAGGLNLNRSSFHYLDELPSYDESMIAQFDESPPPSYDQCTTTTTRLISSSTSSSFISSSNATHRPEVGQDQQQLQLPPRTNYSSRGVVMMYEEKDVNQGGTSQHEGCR
ncbi:uncharacterized protein LOC118434703 [Folsomia candida]|uniref:uncharacterized protein LOC118434703 n=1 Tax=Folsomia candida TaxID=158441 RepID=UPI0016051529|nr:uncharacterized protein LOC118434703 [Folsomia candida]